MNAIIVTGGKQYKVAEGDVVYIEKLPQEAGDAVKFDQVLAVIDGDKATFGAPTVAGASVEAKVNDHYVGITSKISRPTPACIYYYYSTHQPLSSMHLEY